MARVEPIQAAMIPEIYHSLLSAHTPHLSEGDWRRTFCHPWDTGREPLGFALIDAGKIVGVLGTIFSSRVVEGRTIPFCNLHTWVVAEAHRGHALLLMRPVLRRRDHTVTDFTPTRSVAEISRKLGFSPLDRGLRILMPLPTTRRSDPGPADISTDSTAICDRLGAGAGICIDHRECETDELLVSDGDSACYVIYTTGSRGGLRYAYVQHVSDRGAFERLNRPLRRALQVQAGVRLIALDCRIADGLDLPRSFELPLKAPKLYRSPDLVPSQIDNLYSELILLQLSGLSNVSFGLTRGLRRLVRAIGVRSGQLC